jgi:effector-binding domain-containing protein
MVETVKYEVILKEWNFEIRLYPKILVATVRDTTDSNFNILFQYISGANMSKTKIAMTSPVISSEKIAMTSPVISTPQSMSFIIPTKYDVDTVPEPTDKRISIEEIPEKKVATVRFRGFTRKGDVEEQSERLLKWLSDKKIDLTGVPFLMRYNPPYIPWFLRRNELGVEVNHES